MDKQTFDERVNDKNKVPLDYKFKENILIIAIDNGLKTNDVWLKWVKYTNTCQTSGQSALLREFKSWNNLK